MKVVFLTLIFSMYYIAAFCQSPLTGNETPETVDNPTGEPYTLAIQVINKKGKPFKAVPVIINVEGGMDFYDVSSAGMVYIPGIYGNDTLNVFAGQRMFKVEVGGYDSLNIVFNNPRRLRNAYGQDVTFNTGYGEVDGRDNAAAYSALEVRNAEHYTNLLDYLKGRIAGLEVVGNTIRIRGIGSINLSTEPLFVVDGIAMDLNSANTLVAPRDIKSITVDKTGSMYGVRGANGVIIITTRNHPE